MRLVLDTNVLVAGLINSVGPPGRILDRIRSGSLALMVDDRVMEEYTCVLRRPRFKRYFSASQVRDILEFIQAEGERVISGIVVQDLPDLADVVFLEIALTADVPLVSGNVKDFPEDRRRGATVLTPAAFVKQFLADKEQR